MKTTALVFSLFFAIQLIYSQQTISASGGNAIGTGSSSYSVGQLVYTTITGSGTVVQGVQQSIELFTLSNPELTSINLTAVTYPNPTSDFIVLVVSNANYSNLGYVLYDLNGREVLKGIAAQANTQIDMLSLASGSYFLKVNDNKQELKTFKIIKK